MITKPNKAMSKHCADLQTQKCTRSSKICQRLIPSELSNSLGGLAPAVSSYPSVTICREAIMRAYLQYSLFAGPARSLGHSLWHMRSSQWLPWIHLPPDMRCRLFVTERRNAVFRAHKFCKRPLKWNSVWCLFLRFTSVLWVSFIWIGLVSVSVCFKFR